MRITNRCCWMLLLAGALMAVTSAARINRDWLVPGGGLVVNKAIYTAHEGKFIALTFDDGPDSIYTPQVAKVLQHYGVKATFMLVGRRAEGQPAVVKSLAQAGFEIGNHSYSHPEMPALSAEAQLRQIRKTEEILKQQGISAHWFRPPYGAFNKATVHAAASLGLETILWSVDPRDWSQPGTRTIEARVLNNTGNAAVILMHSTNPQTVAALPHIIETLQHDGYAFLTLTEWHKALGDGRWRAPAAPKTAPLEPVPGLPESGPGMPQLSAISNGNLETMAESFDVPLGANGESRVVDRLEAVTPAKYAPRLALAVRRAFLENASQSTSTAAQAAAQGAPAGPGAAPESQAQALAERSFRDHQGRPEQQLELVQLRVIANFRDISDLAVVFSSERGMALQYFESQSALNVPTGQPEPILDQPVAPEGPAAAAAAAGAPSATSAPAVSTLSQLPLNLLDVNDPRNAWIPQAGIDTADFANAPLGLVDGRYCPPARIYLLSTTPDASDELWYQLAPLLRLGKLDGVVLSDGASQRDPGSQLGVPWTRAPLASLDRAAIIDLTEDSCADILELIAGGKPNIFLALGQSSLPQLLAAQQFSGMSQRLRDFVLLRQATAGLLYDPAGAQAAPWQLPQDVRLARFTDGGKSVLVLYTRVKGAFEVRVPMQSESWSRVTLDGAGWLRAEAPGTAKVVVGASPVILVSENPPPQA